MSDRTFETDASVSMTSALDMIRAALDDEGLALGPSATRDDKVTSVIAGGKKVFRVPAGRVMTREDDRAMRAAWAAQRERSDRGAEADA